MANNIVEEPGEDEGEANLAVANRKRAFFLTEIGPEAYSTLTNILAPLKRKGTPFADIVKALEKHYNPNTILFLPGLPTTLAPLHELLKKECPVAMN